MITDHLIPGRWAAARQPTKKEIAATALISLPLAEASVKIRTGMPVDELLGSLAWATGDVWGRRRRRQVGGGLGSPPDDG